MSHGAKRVRQTSQGHEHLVEYERSEILYLVIPDRARPSHLILLHRFIEVGEL